MAHITVHPNEALIPLFIHPGGTGTTVKVDANQPTINVHQNGRHNPPTSTQAAGTSITYTPAQAPVFIAAPSTVASLTITGPGYVTS